MPNGADYKLTAIVPATILVSWQSGYTDRIKDRIKNQIKDQVQDQINNLIGNQFVSMRAIGFL